MPYSTPVEFEALDTYSDDADDQDEPSTTIMPNTAPPPTQSRPATLNVPVAPSITPQLHPISPLVSNNTPAPAPVARRGRGSSRVQNIQDSLQSLQSSSSAAPLAHFALNAVMDNLMDQSVSSIQFASLIDAYIRSLPEPLHKELQSRQQVVTQAIYRKAPAVAPSQVAFQAKTRVSRPIDSNTVSKSWAAPRSMKEALSSAQRQSWIEAKDKECNSFKERQTYITPRIPIADIPKDLIIPSKMVFDIKKHPDGSFDKFKCRIVARGDRWKDVYRQDTYAGTARTESIKIILAIAAELDLHLESVDVKTAFLYPPLKPDEVIYMRRPAGLTDEDMPEVVQLTHCIYGLPTASAYFRDHSDTVLKSIGFKPTISDPQVYSMHEDGEFVIVSTHVDDFGFASTSKALIDKVKSLLSRTYEISSNPDMSSYLGLNITRNRKLKQIFINQPGYVDDLISTFALSESLEYYPLTPMRVDYGTRVSLNTALNASLDSLLSADQIREFQSRVGACSYLAMQSRPDILYAVNTLSRKTKQPNLEDWEAIQRVLHYIVGSRDLGLLFHSGEGIKLYATVDASYATHSDLKSHTGCTLHIGRHSASFRSLTKKQSVMADSSTVAEYIGAHVAAKEILWARNFLFELGFEQQEATTLFEDNQSTIKLIGKPGNGNKTKHIDLRFNFIRDQVAQRTIQIEYLPTTEMISDILTKPLGTSSFVYLRASLLGLNNKAQ